MKQQLILIALNEFNVSLLEDASSRWSLPSIKRLLSMPHCSTSTDDREEHKGLDPWAQWASIHTGVPLSEHGLRRLGDAENLRHSQIWETLEQNGVSCGIWGAMNATAGKQARPAFFLPDPWIVTEHAYPDELNDFLALPRYYATNYLSPRMRKLISGSVRMLCFLLLHGPVARLLRESPRFLSGVVRLGLNDQLLFSQFDLMNTHVFLKYQRRFSPQFSLLFLNSIAHLQHHAWSPDDVHAKQVEYSMRELDRILELLFSALPEHEFVIMNGLGQRNIAELKRDVLYRQRDPTHFLNAMGIDFERVEQRMTNDSHVRFRDERSRAEAVRLLESARIAGRPMFDIELRNDELTLFFQLDFWNEAPPGLGFELGEESHLFSDHFERIVVRTGEHVPEGDVFTTLSLPARSLMNHEIHKVMLDYFGIQLPGAVSHGTPDTVS